MYKIYNKKLKVDWFENVGLVSKTLVLIIHATT